MKTIDELLQKVVEADASDLHLKVGSPPTIRVDGELIDLDEPSCTPEDTKDYAASLMSEKQIRRFSETNEIDFAYSAPSVGRYRVNVYRQRGTISIALRQVVTRVPDLLRAEPSPGGAEAGPRAAGHGACDRDHRLRARPPPWPP